MNYASWPVRVGAALVDAIPAVILSGLGYLIAGPSADDPTIGPLYYVFALLSLVYTVYNRWYLGGQGASLGKKALGVRLLKEQTGQPLGFGGAFVRDICHIVDTIICYIGYLFPLWDAKRQTLADKITGSLVVKA
ncbi:RDD family protein [Dactylosporangium sp. NPDC000244]|uniref:RDD family protein n=1 Tax=Dactylosporangium sp. NPDC000244 TaxID=3154365 RepID=UPI00332E23DF